jgi:CheY-like chemotaxis protein
MRELVIPPPLRVLVVDDCPDTRASLHILLELWGFEVREAADGPSALAEASAFQPEAVLLDIGLPGLDGYQVARRLRQMFGRGQVLLVAVTGYGRESDQARARAAGFDHHLLKPVPDLDLLRDLLASRTPRRRHGAGHRGEGCLTGVLHSGQSWRSPSALRA